MQNISVQYPSTFSEQLKDALENEDQQLTLQELNTKRRWSIFLDWLEENPPWAHAHASMLQAMLYTKAHNPQLSEKMQRITLQLLDPTLQNIPEFFDEHSVEEFLAYIDDKLSTESYASLHYIFKNHSAYIFSQIEMKGWVELVKTGFRVPSVLALLIHQCPNKRALFWGDIDGSPLHWAVDLILGGERAIARILLNSNYEMYYPDLFRRNSKHDNPLELAIKKGKSQWIEILLELCPLRCMWGLLSQNPNQENDTPAYLVARKGNTDTVKAFFSHLSSSMKETVFDDKLLLEADLKHFTLLRRYFPKESLIDWDVRMAVTCEERWAYKMLNDLFEEFLQKPSSFDYITECFKYPQLATYLMTHFEGELNEILIPTPADFCFLPLHSSLFIYSNIKKVNEVNRKIALDSFIHVFFKTIIFTLENEESRFVGPLEDGPPQLLNFSQILTRLKELYLDPVEDFKDQCKDLNLLQDFVRKTLSRIPFAVFAFAAKDPNYKKELFSFAEYYTSFQLKVIIPNLSEDNYYEFMQLFSIPQQIELLSYATTIQKIFFLAQPLFDHLFPDWDERKEYFKAMIESVSEAPHGYERNQMIEKIQTEVISYGSKFLIVKHVEHQLRQCIANLKKDCHDESVLDYFDEEDPRAMAQLKQAIEEYNHIRKKVGSFREESEIEDDEDSVPVDYKED